MTHEEVREALTPIFREVFQDDTIELTDQMTAEDIEGWDSAAHVNLLLAIEMRLGVRFRTSEIDEMKTVGDLISMIEEKLNR